MKDMDARKTFPMKKYFKGKFIDGKIRKKNGADYD